MSTDLFGSILEELGTRLHMKLHADAHQSCMLKTKDGVKIQIELARDGRHLLLASEMPELPMSGSYRSMVFREALKANGMPSPRCGIFAYSKPAGKLILFSQLEAQDLTGDKLYAYFNTFLAKAKIWYSTILRGDVPTATSTSAAKHAAGMFGLR